MTDSISTSLQGTFDSLGLTELTGLMLTITAMSGTFYFVMGIVTPIINKAVAAITHSCSYSISIHTSDPRFSELNLWLRDIQNDLYFQRSYKISRGRPDITVPSAHNTIGEESEIDGGSKCQDFITAGYGSVIINTAGFPIMSLHRSKDEGKQIYEVTETLNITFWAFRKMHADHFLEKLITYDKKDEKSIIYESDDGWWQKRGKVKQTLPPSHLAGLEFIADAEQFFKMKDMYNKRGIPHKKGYLLYGPPGTGKTSIISHLASKNKLSVYNLSDSSISKFAALKSEIGQNAIILIEDIDLTVVGDGRTNVMQSTEPDHGDQIEDSTAESSMLEKMGQSTLREFLNALDGITELNSCIVVATTNNPDALDTALLRPGRIDKQMYIGPLTHPEQISHINAFYQKSYQVTEVTPLPDTTMAELQLACSQNMTDPDAAIKYLQTK